MGLLGRWLQTVVHGRPDGIRARLRRWLGRGASGADAAQPPPADGPPPAPIPAGHVDALAAADLPEGGLVEVMVRDQPVVLCRVGGVPYAVSGVCPHAGGPVGDGSLDGHTLTCPLHGWSFDVRDGRCFVDGAAHLPTRSVTEVDGRLCVGPAAP